jgi:hypothetical protein
MTVDLYDFSNTKEYKKFETSGIYALVHNNEVIYIG